MALLDNLELYASYDSDLLDSSGNGHHGTAFGGGPNFAAGKIGNGVDLELSSFQYIDHGLVPWLYNASAFTFGFWYIPESLAQFSQMVTVGTSGTAKITIGSGGTGAGGTSAIAVVITNGAANSYGYTAGSKLSVGVPVYLVVRFDGTFTDGNAAVQNAGRLKVDVNGVAQTLTFAADPIPATTPNITTMPLLVGRGGSVYADGITDELAGWSRAILDAEGTQLYNSGSGFPLSDWAPPVNSVAPVVTGTATVGQTLSCTEGTWNVGTKSRQWYANEAKFASGGDAISGATASTFTLTEDEEGLYVYCVVTSTNGVGSTDAASNVTNRVGLASARRARRSAVKYDSRPIGNLELEFARNVATVSDKGIPVAANDRRFLTQPRAVAGLVDWRTTSIDLTGSPQIWPLCQDEDGTHLAMVRNLANGTLTVISVNDGALTIATASTTLLTALPGAGGGVTYNPRCARGFCGLLVLQCEKQDSLSPITTTFFVSTDKGVTWERVENSAIDGGGLDIPDGYEGNSDGGARGREWCITITPHGGIQSGGGYDQTRAWVTWSDYLHGGATARGLTYGVFEIVRSGVGQPWTVNKNRILHSQWYATDGGNIHAHTCGMLGSGLIVGANGDYQHAISTFAVDLDNYETAEITTEMEWFGELDVSAVGRDAPQVIGAMPAPGGDLLFANDVWGSLVLRVSNVTSSAEPCVITSLLYGMDDVNSGNYWNGWENLFGHWYPGYGWMIGSNNVGTNTCRLISYDGVHFAMLNNVDDIYHLNVLAGNAILAFRASDMMLLIARAPEISVVKPLRLSSGGDNLLTINDSLDSFSSPTSPNTRRFVAYQAGEYRFIDNSQLVPNAPAGPPPYSDPILIYYGNESDATGEHGTVYVTDGNVTIGTQVVLLNASVYPLGVKATGRMIIHAGVSGAGNQTPTRGHRPDSTHQWLPIPACGNPTNNPAAARATLNFLSPVTTTALVECPLLVAVGSLQLVTASADAIVPYPLARGTTSNPPEIEAAVLPESDSVSWTATVTVLRPSDAVTSADTTNIVPSGPLFTVWSDADNFVEVVYDGAAQEVVVTPTVGGVEGDPIQTLITLWPRNGQLTISLTSDGLALEGTILSPCKGLSTFAEVDGGFELAPTEIRLSNAAQTLVYNIDVAGIEFRDEYTDAARRAESLTTLDFMQSAGGRPRWSPALSPLSPPIEPLVAIGLI